MDPDTLKEAFAARRTCREFSEAPVSMEIVERLLWAAQGITDAEGNRTVPSAHALHPLCLYLCTGNIRDNAPAVYEVSRTDDHLDLIKQEDVRPALMNTAVDDQPWIGAAAGIITIAADMVTPARDFADQLPLGNRGARYVYIEAGAAAQNVLLQATVENLGCVLVAGFRDEATADALNLEPPVAPILHVCFGWPVAASK